MSAPLGYQSANLYFMDESRFGLFTRAGRMLAATGVKPVCTFQQVFRSTYLFGAFSPIDGDSLCLEMPFCNTETFQRFLDELSIHRPQQFKVITIDNGGFHKSNTLKVPENTALLFLPPYSPELNPAEKIWQIFKRKFSNRIHNDLDKLSDFLKQVVSELKPQSVISTCSFEYISSSINWTI